MSFHTSYEDPDGDRALDAGQHVLRGPAVKRRVAHRDDARDQERRCQPCFVRSSSPCLRHDAPPHRGVSRRRADTIRLDSKAILHGAGAAGALCCASCAGPPGAFAGAPPRMSTTAMTNTIPSTAQAIAIINPTTLKPDRGATTGLSGLEEDSMVDASARLVPRILRVTLRDVRRERALGARARCRPARRCCARAERRAGAGPCDTVRALPERTTGHAQRDDP